MASYDRLLKENHFERVASKKKSLELNDGDVFVVKPTNHPYVYGRILKANVPIKWYVYDFELDGHIWTEGDPDDTIECVNIYADFTDNIDESRSEPKFKQLLCPPMMLTSHLWEQGGAKILHNADNHGSTKIVEINCFEYGPAEGYFDCEGNAVEKANISGDYGVDNDLGLFNAITKALSITK